MLLSRGIVRGTGIIFVPDFFGQDFGFFDSSVDRFFLMMVTSVVSESVWFREYLLFRESWR
ncbi:hypothetical protein AKJ63_01250 [candidate division MSBL1 archaeon SCGC-AAA259D18]|uniref:Uncharacterized protein n=2 Tax=candidate division MSBL1 TaxID=215777 RepID=A0A133UAR2_9EURY|nr:hypothetical protein AKJ57_01770 [candidate division MSBL1 archaeon SCGC-AAA259A05]KXA91596.1 hypothetical protein AKJ63_01250 [candidate division MSBL1 archaeon SCGC-AAA259D18]